ncbi:Na+/H+ antiporter [Streptomyces luteoverticillatus]|uniref:Na+/H+ antiporter n=1 Tax=Streptomyces luteoverticillatus TaxID=66425 RepID=A0A3Q9FYF9_STRLT|nr:Na+/H+ antiporter [Streptomyces luteoverticillatus]AZQ74724.1 Na+/H+ antiporter [Streptomyces luteoverticillatus]
MTALTAVLLLVSCATLIATGARRWRVPAPSLLVVGGVLIGMLPWVPAIRIAPETISVVVLPPLLFASAEEISWRELRPVWRPVTVLAFGLVLATAAAVGVVASAVTPLGGSTAFVLGAVLASTDPVAVTALGRRLSLPPRARVLVQAESLFNDATSLVLFKVAVATAVTTGAVSPVASGGAFLVLGGGGVLVGGAVAGAAALIRRRTADPVLVTVVALVTPYAAYALAEDLGASGVTAVVVAGVVLGSTGHGLTNAAVRLQVHAVYGTVVFLLESVVFAVIGLELPALVHELGSAGRGWPLGVLAMTGTVLTTRLLGILPLSVLTQRRQGDGRVSWRVPAVLSWAGTRGVMPLAAALSIPLTAEGGAPLPHRPLILVLTTGVVVLTLVVQGFTLAPVVRWSGIALEPEHTAHEEARCRAALAEAGLACLAELESVEAASATVIDQLRRGLLARLDQADADHDGDSVSAADYRELRRAVIAAESAELRRLYEGNRVSDMTRRRVQRALDLEEAGLGE